MNQQELLVGFEDMNARFEPTSVQDVAFRAVALASLKTLANGSAFTTVNDTGVLVDVEGAWQFVSAWHFAKETLTDVERRSLVLAENGLRLIGK